MGGRGSVELRGMAKRGWRGRWRGIEMVGRWRGYRDRDREGGSSGEGDGGEGRGMERRIGQR